MPVKDFVRVAEGLEALGAVVVIVVVEGFADEVLLLARKNAHGSNGLREGGSRGNVTGADLPRRRGIRRRVLDFDARGFL
jgi:hypothetical protein